MINVFRVPPEEDASILLEAKAPLSREVSGLLPGNSILFEVMGGVSFLRFVRRAAESCLNNGEIEIRR